MTAPDSSFAPTETLAHAAAGTGLSFMEVQFPVSKLSKESYKERKANHGQTLTGLGKWWGRKPLVLCRATILGLLMPASADPRRDRDVFLKLMTMDADGLWRRKNKPIPLKELFARLPEPVRAQVLDAGSTADKAKWNAKVSRATKDEMQRLAFEAMSYDEKLAYCCRPEEIEGPSPGAWDEINSHLGSSAKDFPTLVAELGRRRFGHIPRVGDAFCGGGSVPFEAARLGCDAYGSDLNPVAALLTWSALNIVGGGREVADAVRKAQREVFEAVDRQVTEWGIEHNEKGWRADAYLYCVETRCPECGWMVPMAPAWVIGEKSKCVAKLVPDPVGKRFHIEIHSGVTGEEMRTAKEAGTAKDANLVCPNHDEPKSTPIRAIRGDRGETNNLRPWENDDVVPRPDDIFQERLYCVRWVKTEVDDLGATSSVREYRSVDADDEGRERKVLELLRGRFRDWQSKGSIPSRKIEPGEKTLEPIRTRGWRFWHQLFSPRQLLLIGLASHLSTKLSNSLASRVAILLATGRCADYDSKLSRWDSSAANEKTAQTFSGRSLSTLYNYGMRTWPSLEKTILVEFGCFELERNKCDLHDVRVNGKNRHIWITDPPYADAVNYHELSEFVLSWYDKQIPNLFPSWYSDSKRALAVRGSDQSFRQSMVECYRNLAAHMPDNGMQVVMFTHQDAAVWADLALILWAAGLRVTAAWCLQTETESDLKQGNFVQGTVLLVLRKQTETEPRFLDEVFQDVETEVRRQLDSMLALDDQDDPNFGDPDYQLAAYAAALRVLTDRPIEEIDVARELSRVRPPGETSPIVALIENAVRIACDHLVPRGLETHLWKTLTGIERFYLKGLELESHGERRVGAYQDLARGFGAGAYDGLLASTRANEARLKSAGEFGPRDLGTPGFGSTLVRHCLFAAHKTRETDATAPGLTWLKDRDNVPDYWASRERLVGILDFLASLKHFASLPHWHADARAAELLAGAVRNDHV